MERFMFDQVGFRVDGKDAFMLSGEFHYFRVPQHEWKRRMQLYKDAGGNCIASYVPWCIHERKEGEICFDDIPERSITKFLQTAKEVGLCVTLRPGPYQYSELVGSGLPDWLFENYPEILARDIDGNTFEEMAVSYLHPLFLEKVKPYYKAFCEVIRPFVGDPVVMLQTDNEAVGIHVWFGSIDYHPLTYGFGREDGRYPRFLQKKYGEIQTLNAAYGSDFACFADVKPAHPGKGKQITLRRKDYYDCYYDSIADYLRLLQDELIANGIDLPICHNSANPSMNSCFVETVERMKKPFLLGSDHYYTLHPGLAQNNPPPQYAIKCFYSMEMMRLMGCPPSVLELPGGSPSDTPPILPNDLLACYMTNLAMGMKGCNYYIFTGGPNFADTGGSTDIYDYNALVRADGSLNETYESLKTFHALCNSHTWMQRGGRVASANVGFEWMATREESDDFGGETVGAFRFTTRGVLYAMFCGSYAPALCLLDAPIPMDKPLIVPCGEAMSQKAQQNIVDYVKGGGKVLLMGILPKTDLDFAPCSILVDAVGGALALPYKPRAVRFDGLGNINGLAAARVFEKLPENADVLAIETVSGKAACIEKKIGAGTLTYLASNSVMTCFDQAKLMEYLLGRLGGGRCVESSNRNLFTSLWADETGKKLLFVMNLYASPQKTRVTVFENDKAVFVKEITLAAMEVKAVDLPQNG